MALSLEITLRTGVTATYWRITRVEIDGLANTTKAYLSGYLSQTARNEGKRPVRTYEFLWSGEDNPVTPSVIMAGTAYTACYNKIKAEVPSIGNINPPLFGSATDV